MKIYVSGSSGMVGSAIIRKLKEQISGGADIEILQQSHQELDLLDQNAVKSFFESYNPDIVIMAAAKVGGIHANDTYPANFIYENLMMECNVIHQSYKRKVQKLLFLGSSCIYPVNSSQPMSEKLLLSGYLESTNEPYAIAKIAGIKLCNSYNKQYGTDFRTVMPTNLYGPNDNFHEINSHVIPGLIRRFHKAKIEKFPKVEIWGTGTPMREFLHVDDMAAACIYILNLDKEVFISSSSSHINIGTGIDCSIRDLAEILKEITGYSGEVIFDSNKRDGAPRKLLDTKVLQSLGWNYTINLADGLEDTYKWYLENQDSFRG